MGKLVFKVKLTRRRRLDRESHAEARIIHPPIPGLGAVEVKVTVALKW
jgi:hypothetical protein